MPKEKEPQQEFFCYNGAEFEDGIQTHYESCLLQNAYPHDVCEYRYGTHMLSVANQDPMKSRPIVRVKSSWVDLFDLSKPEDRIGVTSSFEEAWAWAIGYLKARGGEVNDGQRILALEKKSGNFQIYGVGAMLERGEDYELHKLEQAQRQADAEARVAAEAIEAYRKAQANGTEPR